MVVKKWFLLCLSVLLVAFPLPGEAVHWINLGQTEEGLVSMDRDSLQVRSESSVKVWEKVIWSKANAKGVAGELRHQEYDMKKKQWRRLSTYSLNRRGKKVQGNRKIGEWQPFEPMTPLFTRARYERDYAHLQGPWVFIRTLPGVGKKYFNPKSLEKKGRDTYVVWEKTVMQHPVNGTSILLSQTRYDVNNKKARTLYLCTFDKKEVMLDYYAVSDAWSASDDQYGEYIGEQIAAYYQKHPQKSGK